MLKITDFGSARLCGGTEDQDTYSPQAVTRPRGGGHGQSVHLAEIRGSIAFGRGGNIAGSPLEESLERGGKGTCSSFQEWLDAGMLTYADIC